MKNDITGDELISKPNSDAYREGWDRIFKKGCGPGSSTPLHGEPAEFNSLAVHHESLGRNP